ncbi:DUF736 domain-containing protein [Parvularcula sp. IMCC14364]|uniref:DUF736 domain-containing protein n=1 Tax=Parvularcula sp. IMCC14364 TaxID=3067902 RepID=UPI002741777D|nr:DUF736 domain-containing protein [Parvularcula sp. IMCC14364]
MATIGTFSKTEKGYTGTIRTMTINVKSTFVPNDKNGNDKAPDFRIYAGGAELGAAWRAKGKGDKASEFLSVELDDPSFAKPIRAAFFEKHEDNKGVLVWTRSRPEAGARAS